MNNNNNNNNSNNSNNNNNNNNNNSGEQRRSLRDRRGQDAPRSHFLILFFLVFFFKCSKYFFFFSFVSRLVSRFHYFALDLRRRGTAAVCVDLQLLHLFAVALRSRWFLVDGGGDWTFMICWLAPGFRLVNPNQVRSWIRLPMHSTRMTSKYRFDLKKKIEQLWNQQRKKYSKSMLLTGKDQNQIMTGTTTTTTTTEKRKKKRIKTRE